MDNRIAELKLQARNYALDEKRIYERVHNTEQCMEEYREVYNKKFAELIVRECIRVARGADGLDATHEAWYLIEQHFGVEE
jgi:hypothetical protein